MTENDVIGEGAQNRARRRRRCNPLSMGVYARRRGKFFGVWGMLYSEKHTLEYTP